MRNTPDKRYFDRLKTNSFSIDYKIINTNGINKADVINISAGGICFLRTSILEKGDIIQIKFPFHARKVILTGEIIRIEGREVAVKFLDEERQIDRFVENFNIEFLGVKTKSKKNIDKTDLNREEDVKSIRAYGKFFNDTEKD
ncbi:MAG: PilZ domain-containing protein [Spirochaetes bacterium]|nr:PilZ domain-containing protein [Spirochaetota bacterium]